jgi:CubicO group peptidase (beta-lactamase class C family)
MANAKHTRVMDNPTADKYCGIAFVMNRFYLSILIAMTIFSSIAKPLPASQVAAMEAILADFNQPDAPGASVMIVHDGAVIFSKGYGLADLETKTPITPETNFRLASVSKQFTAMAVLILRERGKLSLDENLLAFFPEFPAFGRQITVRHLLTHTSGLLAYEDLIPEGTTIPVLDQDVLRILMTNGATNTTPTYFPEGSQYRYSNSAYALLALIVQARSGQTFAHFLKENIFTPFGMTNTLAYEAGSSAVPNRSYGHSLRTNGWQRTDQSLTSSVLGDGGIYSSVNDLFKWNQALYTTKLVSAKALEEAFTPKTPTDKPGKSYGYGWYLTEHRDVKQIWHSGESIGFRSRLVRIPDKKFCVIILANRSDKKLEEKAEQIIDLVLLQGR